MPDFIAIPGQYSGDMWHVAAACLVRRDVVVVVTIASRADAEGAPTIIEFFSSIGLGKRVKVVRGKAKSSTVELDGVEEEISTLPGKPLMWQHTAFLQQLVGEHTVHPLYRCTSMVMRAMEEVGRERVIETLQTGLAAGLPVQTCTHIASYAGEILAHNAGRKLLFVLGRLAGYNPQHDLDEERLRAIGKAAAKAGYAIVLVGFPKKLEVLASKAGVEVHGYLDLRDWTSLTGSPKTDERARAYFWRCLVELAPNLGVTLKFVGGRSGSTDLPAFMGMDVLSWDICDVYNPEYLRLLLTAPLLMWVTHVDVTLWKGSAMNVVPEGGCELARDVLQFLCGSFCQPKLVCVASGALTKKSSKSKGDLIAQTKLGVLRELERVATIVFVLPYDIRSKTGQHFPTVRDSSTAPLEFNAINHALRPYYGSTTEVPDLARPFRYTDRARRFIHEGVTVLTELESHAPTRVINLLALKVRSKTRRKPQIELELSKSSSPSLQRRPSHSPPRSGLFPPVIYHVNDRVRVRYHCYYDVVGTVTKVVGNLVSVRVDECYRPGTTTDYRSDHTAIVLGRVLGWRPDQIDGHEG